MLKETTLITHKNCMDGSGCAILYLAMGGKNIVYTHPDHDSTSRVSEDYLYDSSDLIFADCSIPVDLAEKFTHRGRVVLLDHHKTAIPLKKFDWCEIEVENKRSGAKMLYEYFRDFFPDEFKKNNIEERFFKLIEYIDDHDRWIHKHKYSSMLSNMHKFLGQEYFIKVYGEKFSEGVIYLDEESLLEILEKEKEGFIKERLENVFVEQVPAFWQDQEDTSYSMGFVGAARHHSELGNAMLNELSLDIACIVSPQSFSLRSRKGVDCSSLAKYFGGGGHTNAAGFSVRSFGWNYVEEIARIFKEDF